MSTNPVDFENLGEQVPVTEMGDLSLLREYMMVRRALSRPSRYLLGHLLDIVEGYHMIPFLLAVGA
jgi:uncharacterized protein (DUF2062 family)